MQAESSADYSLMLYCYFILFKAACQPFLQIFSCCPTSFANFPRCSTSFANFPNCPSSFAVFPHCPTSFANFSCYPSSFANFSRCPLSFVNFPRYSTIFAVFPRRPTKKRRTESVRRFWKRYLRLDKLDNSYVCSVAAALAVEINSRVAATLTECFFTFSIFGSDFVEDFFD